MTISDTARNEALKASSAKTLAWQALCEARLNKADASEVSALQQAYDESVRAERESLHKLQAAIMLSTPPVRRVSFIRSNGLVDVTDFREDPMPNRAQAKFDEAVTSGALAAMLLERDRSTSEDNWIVLDRFPQVQ